MGRCEQWPTSSTSLTSSRRRVESRESCRGAFAVAVTEHDIERFAARIRLHFEPDLRDVAFDRAHAVSGVVGARVKLDLFATKKRQLSRRELKDHGLSL